MLNIEKVEKTDTTTDEELESMYSVIFFNDDVTNVLYVLLILTAGPFFYPQDVAVDLVNKIQEMGECSVATLPLKEAYEKVDLIEELNGQYNQFLQTDVVKC